jgi:ribulose-5-phosphate 4-epimerase/fuculose-1-phosphate aldolase
MTDTVARSAGTSPDAARLGPPPYASDAPFPRAMRGLERALTVPEQLACALRILARHGWTDSIGGHITWVEHDAEGRDTGNLWVNPWGIWWEEVRASDILLVSGEGEVLAGRWDVTPAVHIHTELHRARADAAVVVHNHPYHATILANLGIAPEIAHQNACIFDGELGLVDEYDGSVDTASAGERLARAVGSASGVLLVSHGAIVTGPTIEEAAYKAVQFERLCQMQVDALRLGRTPVGIRPEERRSMQALLRRNAPDSFWHGAVRLLLRDEPDVLE